MADAMATAVITRRATRRPTRRGQQTVLATLAQGAHLREASATQSRLGHSATTPEMPRGSGPTARGREATRVGPEHALQPGPSMSPALQSVDA